MEVKALKHVVRTFEGRSAWSRGVTDYALELIDDADQTAIENAKSAKELREELLNGASDWREYSWNGCSLIYDSDIAERLCTPSELKKTHHGDDRPNRNEEWLDVQARALYQACSRIVSAWRTLGGGWK